MYFEGVRAHPYIFWGDRITWKVLDEYGWSPTTTRSGSFPCTAASSTSIRVVTKEVWYIHVLPLTLPGLTTSEARLELFKILEVLHYLF